MTINSDWLVAQAWFTPNSQQNDGLSSRKHPSNSKSAIFEEKSITQPVTIYRDLLVAESWFTPQFMQNDSLY